VPGTLIVLARADGDGDREDTGDEVGRAGEDETDDLAEAEGLDDYSGSVLLVIHMADLDPESM
jgi:hypothetical protein